MTVPVIEVWPEAQENPFWTFRKNQDYYSSAGRMFGDFFAGIAFGIVMLIAANIMGVLGIIGFAIFLSIIGRGWLAGGLVASLFFVVIVMYAFVFLLNNIF